MVAGERVFGGYGGGSCVCSSFAYVSTCAITAAGVAATPVVTIIPTLASAVVARCYLHLRFFLSPLAAAAAAAAAIGLFLLLLSVSPLLVDLDAAG